MFLRFTPISVLKAGGVCRTRFRYSKARAISPSCAATELLAARMSRGTTGTRRLGRGHVRELLQRKT